MEKLPKGTLVPLTVGISIGLFISYFFAASSLSFVVTPVRSVHDETGDFRGPHTVMKWRDQHGSAHIEESSVVADRLAKDVRVLCWVLTQPDNHQKKAIHVKATWGKRCNWLVFVSSSEDADLPAVSLNVTEGRDHLWGKTKAALKYVYEKYGDKADWFMKADDDTYVVMENLRYLLSKFDPIEPVYFGKRFKPYVTQGYMSGGAGYVLSKKAVEDFLVTLKHGDRCRQDTGGSEDVEIGKCLNMAGVIAKDSRDDLGRETFHPLTPENHLIPEQIGLYGWYFNYSYYPANEGPECCSDHTITFHYVTPNWMYMLEYFIYHLRPYGFEQFMSSRKREPWTG